MTRGTTEFVLLSGFLGSGKTSLLLDWLALPEAEDTAVIVNEAGEIDIDGAIIAESGTLPMAMLANGCVCCTLTSDLVFTIRELVAARERDGGPPFRRIVLECSGLSKPGPILRSLMPLAALGLQVRVVTLCDAVLAPRQAEHFEEWSAQVAAAGTLVLSKLDRAAPEPAIAALRAVNPLAPVVAEADGAARARTTFLSTPGAAPVAGLPEAAPHPRITLALARFTPAASWEERLDWLEDLAAFCGDRLLRVKGLLHPPSGPPLLVQGVGTVYSPLAPLPGAIGREEALVVILRDLTLAELRSMAPETLVEWQQPSARGLACF
ncbi:CobW family GTP-binding protein [Pseudoroseomonas sp. WGS1072]|uniref:CobW family GTP-binding protein n=1 Tax=Roseomonas sp. WGS1072 TaxID=3366816 RepID=UPI003BF1CD73